MTATEIRNVTGITDDALLNAACECERKEELAEEIAAAIVKAHGYDRGLYNNQVFKFDKVSEVLARYGFKYIGSNEDEESHWFYNKNTNDDIYIYPKEWFPNQGNFRFLNFHLF